MADQPDFTDCNTISYLPRPLIAWEYLRRHSGYRRAWATLRDGDRPGHAAAPRLKDED